MPRVRWRSDGACDSDTTPRPQTQHLDRCQPSSHTSQPTDACPPTSRPRAGRGAGPGQSPVCRQRHVSVSAPESSTRDRAAKRASCVANGGTSRSTYAEVVRVHHQRLHPPMDRLSQRRTG
eukprot:1168036-Rhodomonas_salina.1